MSVGFVMLVHEALDRAASVARHWAKQGCPIVIHVDAAVPSEAMEVFTRSLCDFDHVVFAPRQRCAWGSWSIVEATRAGARMMLDRFPDVRHIYLASGACLPLRPAAELRAFLDGRPDTDFIESVTVEDVTWTVGGLDDERFDLSFPFSWKTQRLLFDAAVRVQRLFGLKRRKPEGLVPHLGSQWWCLTRSTLEAILSDPDADRYIRYFRRVWIPDESYFQTVARRHSRRLESRSLTLSKFDFQGKPHVFYDDHLQILRQSDCFVARKAWHRADGLYRAFLGDAAFVPSVAPPNPGRIDRIFSKAVERRTRGRAGLYMQSRFPNWDWENGRTAAPYSILEGFAELFEDFPDWLSETAGVRVHGHLFAPERAEFADGQRVFAGALSDAAPLRDYNPVGFLTSLIWNTRGERQCFAFGPRDRQDIIPFLAADPNARFAVISGAWIIPMFRSGRPASEFRTLAAGLQQIEALHLEQLRRAQTRAGVRIWTLSEFLESPSEVLQILLEDVGLRSGAAIHAAPRMVDLSGLTAFIQDLRNLGMHPHIMGDFPVEAPEDPSSVTRPRPRLVN